MARKGNGPTLTPRRRTVLAVVSNAWADGTRDSYAYGAPDLKAAREVAAAGLIKETRRERMGTTTTVYYKLTPKGLALVKREGIGDAGITDNPRKKSLKSRAERVARTDAGRAGIGGGIGALALGPIGAVAGAVIGIGTKKKRGAKGNPKKLSNQELKDKVWSWLQKTEGPGGELSYDAGVQTQEEWASRGEDYSNDADVVIWFEGPLYHALNYGFEEQPAFRTEKKFTKFLAGLGYHYELGNAWNAGLYPN